MEHVVFYPSAEGGPAFKRVNSLDEAVNFVEHLRNSENITEFSVHSLTAVPLAFRAYYHVEVPEDATSPEPAASTQEVAEPAVEETAEAPVAELAEPIPAEVHASPEAPAEPVTIEVEPAVVAEAIPEVAAEAEVPEVTAEVEVPAQAEAPEAAPADDVTVAPVEAPADEDRSDAWVAEAVVVEPPAETADAAPVEQSAAAGPFADAPPVMPNGSEDVVPIPTGKRSMGFFAR